MPRLFAAIRPPAAVRDALIDAMEGLDPARWQGEDQLHLTLRFVGDVDSRTGEDLAAELGRIAHLPFQLALRGVGTFARKGRVHTLWAGVAESGDLRALQKKVERACQACGLEPEHRKFAAHVTIARLSARPAELAEWLAAHEGFASEPWTVDEFRLYQSTLAPGGSHYEPVVRYPLQG